jgi:hypothetical protein
MKYLNTFILALFVTTMSYSQDLNLTNAFKADFNIDSITLGVDSSNVNCSGAAIGYENGDYSAVYLTYHFTNKFETDDSGEFTGLVWAQQGENFLRGTLQGVWRRKGQLFELITLDNINDGNTILAVGELNFATRTLKFDASVVE